MNKLLYIYIIIAVLVFLGCVSTNPKININKLSDKEIKTYNSNPNNTNKIVCKKEMPIGSRIPERVCRMESSIDERSRQDQQSLKEIQNRVYDTTKDGG